MDRHINLSQEELLSLLHLPFFRAPNQLSPFYELQLQGVAADRDPQGGFALLSQKDLWDLQRKELSRDGQLLFIPVFQPTARIMLFSGAHEQVPFQEFYGFKRYLVFFSDKNGVSISGSIREPDLAEHLRKIFPDRRPPISKNKISLLEDEYIALCLMTELVRESGKEEITGEELCQHLIERMQSAEGLILPVLGRLSGDFAGVLLDEPKVLLQGVAALTKDRLLEEKAPGVYALAPYTKVVFFHLVDTREIFLLREELIDGELLVREVSIFNGQHGYFLGRSAHSPQHGRRVVFLEDLEWHELFRILNEVARPSDYSNRLSLEVLRRHQAFTRG
ncbi:MAG: hypothetical protein H6727_16215 [Myxococcales bacterium]|nr:hypothetical protein [Myxococcales bacterium]